MVEVKAGQWWTDRGSVAERHRILVRGLTSKGDIVFCESADGRAYTMTLEYFLKFKEHLPECTSFEWVPEVYPQYRETFDREKYAFVRLDNPFEYTYVLKSGTEEVRQNPVFGYAHISERPKLTEAEALAKIVKPEVYPQYRETYMPNVWAFVRLDSPTKYTHVRLDGKEDPTQNHGPGHCHVTDRTKLTEAEALARIVKPEPKVEYPIYWTTTDTGRFAYYLQTSATHGRCVFIDGRLDHEHHMSPRETNCRTRLTEEQAKALIKKPEPNRLKVVDLVETYGSDRSNEPGMDDIDMLKTEVKATRDILARLIDKVADKKIFTDEELVKIIRGY